MPPRPLLIGLVFALPILIVAFSVIMGAYAIAHAAGDAAGAAALWWVAMSCAILAAIGLILLVICLGMQAVLPPAQPPGRDENAIPPDEETS